MAIAPSGAQSQTPAAEDSVHKPMPCLLTRAGFPAFQRKWAGPKMESVEWA